jgi:hypothetical protein
MVFSNEQGREEIARPYGSISNECNLMDYPWMSRVSFPRAKKSMSKNGVDTHIFEKNYLNFYFDFSTSNFLLNSTHKIFVSSVINLHVIVFDEWRRVANNGHWFDHILLDDRKWNVKFASGLFLFCCY